MSIFKTTIKKDVIADITNNNVREIRFPITKFWATRLSDEYSLDDKTFKFKTFEALELSSPSNKDTGGVTYTFEFIRTFVDGEEFVIEFKKDDEVNDNTVMVDAPNDPIVENSAPITEFNDIVTNDVPYMDEVSNIEDDGDSDDVYISNDDVYELVKDWFDNERILENFYEDESVFATNARQVIILPKGKVLGFKRILPVNNDAEVRVEFNINKKIYFDSISDFDIFEEEVFRTLSDIRKNNFVFIWKRYTGIFMDDDGRVYFGIKYSTRKSIGFNRKYNVQ
jgi:hypothetical protein